MFDRIEHSNEKNYIMYSNVNLLTSKNVSEDDIKQILSIIREQYHKDVDVYLGKYQGKYDESTLIVLYLSDDEIKTFLQNIKPQTHVAILPHKEASKAMEMYHINGDMSVAVQDALDETKSTPIDILLCNGLVVLNQVLVGKVHGLKRYVQIFKNFEFLKFQNYTFVTAKEQEVQTAAFGITVVEGYVPKYNNNLFQEHLSYHDGKLSAFIFAPHSILSYIWHMVGLFFYQKFSLGSLPKSLGYIKTSKLLIKSSKPIEYQIDELPQCTRELELEVIKDAFYISMGNNGQNKLEENPQQIEQQNDSIKVEHLPSGELKEFLVEGNIPLIKRAGEEQFKNLFVSLRENASFSVTYGVLMILSVLLATTGLYANSSPVIIGAMILSPLMSPIVSLSMGTIRLEPTLLYKSAKTLFFGVVLALIFSSIYTLLIPLKQITPEMASRLHPQLLDLFVAIISGIAGAYANAKEEVAKSLAGVAIAVALVPPLSVTGIGIGLMNLEVISGSFLLFMTNLIGIVLSASLTFVVLGYSPIKKAVKSIVLTSIMMAVVSIPLVLSFNNLVERNRIIKLLNEVELNAIQDQKIIINIEDITIKNDTVYADVEVVSNAALKQQDLQLLKQKFQEKIDKQIILKANLKLII